MVIVPLQAWISEADRERFDIFLQRIELLAVAQSFFKVFQFFPFFFLNLQGNLARSVQKGANLSKIIHGTSSSCHCWAADAYATR